MMNDLDVRVRINKVNDHRVFGRLSPHAWVNWRQVLSLIVEQEGE